MLNALVLVSHSVFILSGFSNCAIAVAVLKDTNTFVCSGVALNVSGLAVITFPIIISHAGTWAWHQGVLSLPPLWGRLLNISVCEWATKVTVGCETGLQLCFDTHRDILPTPSLVGPHPQHQAGLNASA